MDYNTNNSDLGLSVQHALTSIDPVGMVAGVAKNLTKFTDVSAAPTMKPVRPAPAV